MEVALQPVLRQSLADDLALRIRQLIQSRDYKPGDRLPAIAEMARDFAVAGATVREALRKLETLGLVDIRHGSGVYVGRGGDALLLSNPVFDGAISKKLLVDLIEARIPIEVQSVTLAARHASAQDLAQLRSLLDRAGATLDDAGLLNQTNLAFHRAIAQASGNGVLYQLLDVVGSLFKEEQRVILDIHGSHGQDHAEHVGILEALERRDAALAASRMQQHLDGVREVLRRWDPITHPVA
jgi:GntR family transcriptional repressor for pyruvate dehydrogenase complex